jgi:hypothetical protein
MYGKSFTQLVIASILLNITLLFSACFSDKPLEFSSTNQLKGPLRLSDSNPLYFTDGSDEPLYVTGSHTWTNLIDSGRGDPPRHYDYQRYLSFLQKHNHNFMRLWAWFPPQTRSGSISEYHNPQPWSRTGPGKALDGKLKFDLRQFNQLYFDRLSSRIVAAGDKGIYVSIMLFEGWGLSNDEKNREYDCWTWHPFNINNNINGISADSNGDGKGYEFYTASVSSAVKDLQKAYIRKVVDTVNHLDNVLYEIVNEATSLSVSWQYEMLNYLKYYEATKPKQHLVGMTFPFKHPNVTDLYKSSADWISPGWFSGPNAPDYLFNPPASDGRKVIILDTDHLWGAGGDRAWVWKSFLRGYNPIYMDSLDSSYWDKLPWAPEDARKAMGYTLIYSNRINLKNMSPHDDLTSTKYCLANPGSEYLIYKPKHRGRNPLKHFLNRFFTVNLKAGTYQYEWFNPGRGVIVSTGAFSVVDDNKSFFTPFFGDAVLYIHKSGH